MNATMKSTLATGLVLCIAGAVYAQSSDDLKRDGTNPEQVLTYGMGYAQQRYSPLEQINSSNVEKLVPVWSLSLENDFGEQGQPLVFDGTMFVSNAKWTVAIDALSGKQLWRT